MAHSTWLRVLFLALFVNAHQSVLRLINNIVPTPYLDEVFHIPQAQKYWQGKWTEWDPKITTPPGVYLWSWFFNTIRGGRGDGVTTEDLRFSNAVLLYVLVLGLTLWTTIARRQADTSAILQKEFVIVVFPLLFFFSGLYYTDLFSALTVVLTYVAWEASARYHRHRWIFRILHFVTGLLSLASRQTNVFWVAVFLAGLQIVKSIKDRIGVANVHDPDTSNAYVEDTLYFALSIIQNMFSILPYLVLDLWPSIGLLASFAGFVVWNDGVVLGDKQNHVATIHTPQLLYIWPMMVFFSWPVILSSLAAQLQPLSITKLYARLPRVWVAGLVIVAMAASVHFNTIVHPFTLADNRHYTFYIFRILTRPAWVKYAAVPVYFACAWLVFIALGDAGPSSSSSSSSQATLTSKSQSISQPSPPPPRQSSPTTQPQSQEILFQTEEKNNVPLSFTLIWLVSTTLSLITAPLVEPRYFIIPWLIWRLHVPEPTIPTSARTSATTASTPRVSSKQQSKPVTTRMKPGAGGKVSIPEFTIENSVIQKMQWFMVTYALWLELAWYTIINAGTIYIFLQWSFEWPQEPGNIQRFMW